MKIHRMQLLSAFLLVAGLLIVLDGFLFAAAHIDNYNEIHVSFIRSHELEIGFALIVLAPVLIRKYLWSLLLLVLVVALYLVK